jgi:TonB family protein
MRLLPEAVTNATLRFALVVVCLATLFAGLARADSGANAQAHPAYASGLPKPPYPYAAIERQESGTVILKVSFNSSGKAVRVEMVNSSGSEILDNSSREWILYYWSNPSLANKTCQFPIHFMPSPQPHVPKAFQY